VRNWSAIASNGGRRVKVASRVGGDEPGTNSPATLLHGVPASALLDQLVSSRVPSHGGAESDFRRLRTGDLPLQLPTS